MKSIKVGIVGAGNMLSYHIQGFREAHSDIVALAGLDFPQIQKAAEKFQIPNTYASLDELLKNHPDLDAISIITPNKFHCPLVLQALRASKHVFCEKPPGLNAKEVLEMKRMAEKQKRHLLFNFNNRARPEAQALKKYCENGIIGKINSAQAKWCRRTGIPGFGGWFTTKALSGGGPLIDLLHMLDLSLYFMGYPDPAHALGKTYDDFILDKDFKGPWGIPDKKGGPNDVEAAAHAFITFKTGQVLTVHISWAEMIEREEVSVAFQGSKAGAKMMRIFGTDGMDSSAVDTCTLFRKENSLQTNTRLVIPSCEDMGRVGSARNFIETIRGEAKPLNTPTEALKLMKIIDAIYTSSRHSKPIRF
jgi:predicted dehydrogenase